MFSLALGNVVYIILAFAWMMYLTQESYVSGVSLLNMSIVNKEEERKQLQIISGLYKDGVEVWLVSAITLMEGGFPRAFGTIFSSLYYVMFLLLFALIGRGISVEVFYKLESKAWRKAMRIMWLVSSIGVIFLLGVFITNIFLGLPKGPNGVESAFAVLNVTGIAGGLMFMSLSFLAGAAWISLLTEGDIKDRGMQFVKKTGIIYLAPVFFMLVVMGFNNSSASIWVGELFSKYPVLFILPVLTLLSGLMTIYYGYKQKDRQLLIHVLATVALFVITGFVGRFPYILASTVDPMYGITIEQAMSSKKALTVAIVAIGIFYPIVMGYQFWKYKKFWKRIKLNDSL